MYFATNQENLIISYGPESYPGAHYVDDALLPENWNEVFVQCKLGYENGEFFVFDGYIENVDVPLVEDAAS